jgi:hypothetical protein
MSIFSEIIGGNLGKLFKDVMGSFKLDPAVKAQMEKEIDDHAQEIALKQMELQNEAEKREANLVSAQRDIMVAEMNQGDTFTKRARPMVVYAGLLFMLLDYVILPYISFFNGKPLPSIEMPGEFWWAWTGVVGVWMIGRTMEKRGSTSPIVGKITGGVK